MLMMSRNVGESLRIGDDTLVTVVSVRGQTARLAIDAPREIKVVREEQLKKAAMVDVTVSNISLRQ
jgi:carbon storage regulator